MRYNIIEHPKGCNINHKAIEIAINSPKIKHHLEGKEIDKIIYIDKKLINIVTK